MSPTFGNALRLGAVAERILAQAKTGHVLGITSQGVFIQFQPHWVVFVTHAPEPGPLTINLADTGVLSGLKIYGQVLIQDGWAVSEASGFRISFTDAAVWIPPESGRLAYRMTGQVAPIFHVAGWLEAARHLISLRPEAWGSQFLASLVEGYDNVSHECWSSQSLPDVSAIQTGLKDRQVGQIAVALEKLLGLGSGLTPSGDDFICGFLLALNRWGWLLQPGLDLDPFNQTIHEAALTRTSHLSASLIYCATEAMASEALISILDGLMTDDSPPSTHLPALLKWGSSSGCDTFAGMAAAVLL